MNRAEYAAYESAVKKFFESEGITNLSGGHLKHDDDDCGGEWNDKGKCVICGTDREAYNEHFFSWRPCECCKRQLGGDREHATGYNPTTKEIQEYSVCQDCLYYAEYGQLDDTTMLEVENNVEKDDD
jgi:hypothetical protein